MPGPKMGPRPRDFDENLVKQAPTFIRWQKLETGQKLRYACRDFVKGHGDDEERLMRRIMIARRNNLRDHAILKRARAQTGEDGKPIKSKEEIAPPPPPPPKKKRGNNYAMTDDEVMREMDVPAVEGTRSFKLWLGLEVGQTFTYNQTYVKGKEGHDWLLKKNIWRRMRYRRENKKMVEKLKGTGPELSSAEDELDEDSDHHHIPVPESTYSSVAAAAAASVATHIVDHALPANLLNGAEVNALNDAAQDDNLHDDVVEAAVAAAESYVKRARESDTAELVVAQSTLEQSVENTGLSVHNPIMSVLATAESDSMTDHHHTPNPLVRFDGDALDVAAKLAAAASVAANESDEDFNHTPV
jgi:hypothetical protein